MKKIFITTIVTLSTLIGCSGSIYFNTWFNLSRNLEHSSSWLDSYSNPEIEKTKMPDSVQIALIKVTKKGTKILTKWPEDDNYKPEVLAFTAYANCALGKHKEGIKLFDIFEKNYLSHDSLSFVEYQRALCYKNMNEKGMAKYAFEEISQNDHHNYKDFSIYHLSEMGGASDYLGTIRLLKKLLSRKGTPSILRAKAHYRLGTLYFDSKKYKKSLRHLKNPSFSFLKKPLQFKSLILYSKSLTALQKFDQAIIEIDSIPNLTQAPNDYELLFLKANIYKEINKFTLSDSLYNILFKNKSPNIRAKSHWYLGRSYYDRNNLKGAQYILDNGSKISGGQPWSDSSRVLASALQQLLASLKKNNKKLSNKEELALAELFANELSEPDSAISRLQNLLNSLDTNFKARALYNIAFLLENALSNQDSSEIIYRQVIQNYPNTIYAEQAQKNIGDSVSTQNMNTILEENYLKIESLWVSLPIVNFDADSIELRSSSSAYDDFHALTDSLYQHGKNNLKLISKTKLLSAYTFISEKKYDEAKINLIWLEKNSIKPWQSHAKKLLANKSNNQTGRSLEQNKRQLENLKARLLKKKEWRIKQDSLLDSPKSTEEEILWDYNQRFDMQ